MALKIDIAANTRQAATQVKNLGDDLETVVDALEDVGKEGDRTGDKLEDTLKDVERRAKDAGDGIKKGVGDGLKDAGDEAQQSGREAAASFTGEWDDVGDFLQETVANGLGGFGPVGATAGIVAAAGLGAVTAELTRQQEEADKTRERIAGIYQEAAEAGRDYIDTAQIISEANDLMFNPDRADEWKGLQEDAKRLGLDNYTIIAANTGEMGAQEEVRQRINALLDQELQKESDSTSIVGNIGQNVMGLKNRWEEVIGTTEEQQAKVRELQDIQAAAEQSQREQINRTADTAAARYDGLARQYGVPLRGKVVMDVDDSAVRNYKPPSIRGTVRLSPKLDQAV